MFVSVFFMSGLCCFIVFNIIFLLLGDVSIWVILINSFLLVVCIGVLVVNRKKDNLSGFMVLVIIC